MASWHPANRALQQRFSGETRPGRGSMMRNATIRSATSTSYAAPLRSLSVKPLQSLGVKGTTDLVLAPQSKGSVAATLVAS